MRNLLQATDRDRLVAHLRGPLARAVTVGGRRLPAMAEADGPEGGSFCAAPGNAAAAELLALPEIRDTDPVFTDAILDFVMAMADAPLPCRRAGIGKVSVLRQDPRDFEILTPFHRFSGNLAEGMVRQHLRGPQERLPPILHTGNLVEFHIQRHRPCVDVETTIVDCGLRLAADGSVVLMHESRIRGRAGWLRARDVDAGTLRYEYEITPGSPLLRVTVTFTAAIKLTQLRVTTAVDALDEAGLELAEAEIGAGAAWRPFGVPKEPGLAIWAENQPVGHVAIGAAGWPEDAPVLHIRPAMPARVMGVKAVAQRPGALHWALLRHGPVDLAAGGSLSVREERLLAVGTRADAAGPAMSRGDAPGLDLDPLPPSGAALAAVAAFLLFADDYAVPPSPERRQALADFLDRHAARLLAGAPGVEDLALAALAMEARLRAGQAAPSLGDLVGRLLARQREDGTFREADDRVPGLPAQGAALLALARALPHLEAASLAPAIARGLGAVAPGPVAVTGAAADARVEGLALAGAGPVPQRRFAEGIAMVARAAGAVVLAAQAVPGALPEETVTRAEELHRQAIALLRPMVAARGATLEVSPSPFGGAATPAAQAAAALALLAPDARIFAMAGG